MGISEVMYSYGLSVFSIALIFLLAYLQIKINKSDLRQWCILVLACSLITNVSIMIQIVNISIPESAIWYEAFSMIGMTIMPVCCFFAVACFIVPDFAFTKKHVFLFVIPIISVIATLTNNMHHLMFKTFSITIKDREYGILFYIMLINMCFTYLLTIISILKYLSNDLKKYKYQIILGFIFMVIPAVVMLLANIKILDMKSYVNGILQTLIAMIAIVILLKYQILTTILISLLSVLNSITDGFIVINRKGVILAYNNVFLKMFDLGKLNIQKLNIKELLEFKEFDTIENEDIDKIIEIKNYNDKIVFERSSDALELTLKYEGTPLTDRKNNNLFLISVIDVTAYSRNIQSIKLNKDALLSRERLASLGQMIGGIAHNLKTPIFSIAGAVEGLEDLVDEYRESISDDSVTIEDHKDIAKDMYNWTEKIEGYLSYMTDIITAIQLQISSGQGKITDQFTIMELIKYINILMKYELKQNLIDLEVNCKIDENTKIEGNINSLVQVLNNLISNSIQAYNQKDDEKKTIILDIYEKSNDIILDITDFAGGISEDVKNKLFKEMVTTKGKNGTGLGLFISYTSIKTGFGGNLCFTTKEGVGTVFKIIIPKQRDI